MPPGVRVGGISAPAKIKEVKPTYPVAACTPASRGRPAAIVGPDGKARKPKSLAPILLDGAAGTR